MKNEQWLAIYNIFGKMEQLCGGLKSTSPDSPDTTLSAPMEEDIVTRRIAGLKGSQMSDYPNIEDLVKVRAHIRTQLEFLRAKLSETLAERDCYLILFAIVAHFDEYVQANYLSESHEAWPPLQRELFQIDDAGEVFYETLDDILHKPQTLPLVYEIFYFCLNHGFRGRYNDNPVKITEYMRRLRAKIPVHDLETIQAEPEETGQIKFVGSMVWFYAAAVAGIVAGYFMFQAASNHWGIVPLFFGW
jgi:type IV/VI secretion system ImpK/VasF family protein